MKVDCCVFLLLTRNLDIVACTNPKPFYPCCTPMILLTSIYCYVVLCRIDQWLIVDSSSHPKPKHVDVILLPSYFPFHLQPYVWWLLIYIGRLRLVVNCCVCYHAIRYVIKFWIALDDLHHYHYFAIETLVVFYAFPLVHIDFVTTEFMIKNLGICPSSFIGYTPLSRVLDVRLCRRVCLF